MKGGCEQLRRAAKLAVYANTRWTTRRPATKGKAVAAKDESLMGRALRKGGLNSAPRTCEADLLIASQLAKRRLVPSLIAPMLITAVIINERKRGHLNHFQGILA